MTMQDWQAINNACLASIEQGKTYVSLSEPVDYDELSRISEIASMAVADSVYGLASAEKLIAYIKAKPGRLAIAGIGKSHHVAQLAAATFASVGIPSLQLDTAHITHGDAGFVMPGDAVLYISKSGRTSEMLNAIKCLANTTKPNQFLLTCTGFEQLPSIVQDFCSEVITLPTICGHEMNGYSPTTSTLSFVSFLNALAMVCQTFTREQFAQHHPGGALGEELN